MFDYEWATVQHTVNCRLAQAVVVPEAIPPERLRPLRRRAASSQRYAGLKEEYYLADFAPGPGGPRRARPRRRAAARGRPHAARGLALPPLRALAVRRRPRPPARPGPGRRPAAHARAARRARAGGRLHRPRAGDRRAVAHRLRRPRRSAGGTMNREAVALGTPVYTTFEGRLGAVDERLIAEGRLRRLERAADLDSPSARRPRRARPARPGRSSSTCSARRSGGLPQLAGEDALGAHAPLGGQAPELGRRARAGQVAGRRDLGRRHRARSAAAPPRRPAAPPARGRPGRQRGRAQRAAAPESSRAPVLAAAASPGTRTTGTATRGSLGEAGRARDVEVGAEGLDDRVRAQVDREARRRPGPATRRAASVSASAVSSFRRLDHEALAHGAAGTGPSRPCSAAALTARQAG